MQTRYQFYQNPVLSNFSGGLQSNIENGNVKSGPRFQFSLFLSAELTINCTPLDQSDSLIFSRHLITFLILMFILIFLLVKIYFRVEREYGFQDLSYLSLFNKLHSHQNNMCVLHVHHSPKVNDSLVQTRLCGYIFVRLISL